LLLKMMFGHIVYDPHQLASKRRGCSKSPKPPQGCCRAQFRTTKLLQRKRDQLLGEIPLKLCASARIGRPSGSHDRALLAIFALICDGRCG
jgi:hypothetical protein